VRHGDAEPLEPRLIAQPVTEAKTREAHDEIAREQHKGQHDLSEAVVLVRGDHLEEWKVRGKVKVAGVLQKETK
jgi:hypothetical protein